MIPGVPVGVGLLFDPRKMMEREQFGRNLIFVVLWGRAVLSDEGLRSRE